MLTRDAFRDYEAWCHDNDHPDAAGRLRGFGDRVVAVSPGCKTGHGRQGAVVLGLRLKPVPEGAARDQDEDEDPPFDALQT